MEAIEKRFGGNTETKKVQKTLLKQQYENVTCSSSESLDQIHDRLQKLISQLKILRVSLSQKDINLKFLRSLPSDWRTHTLTWRNKIDLKEQSLNDLFNSHKIYKAEVKSSSSASTTTQNITFVSSSNTDSTNEPVSDAASVSAEPTNYALMAFSSSSSSSDNEPTEQVKSPRPSIKHVETSIPIANSKAAIPKPTSNGKRRNRKACFVCKSLDHLIKDCDYHERKMAQTTARTHAQRGNNKHYAQMSLLIPQRHLVPVAVLTQSKHVPITAVKPVTTVDKGVIDSGCSRHMTGNMSYLSDFKELNGGYVAFGGNPKGGKISRKGKFDGKVDEGFLVGYSVSSKAFRVFNSRTRIVQETLHVNFLENKPNNAGSGPTWLFDIDTLTRTMNYQPVTAGNQSNPSAGVQDKFDEEKAGEEIVQQYVLFPVINKDNAAGTLVPAVGRISPNSTNTFSAAGPSNTAASPTHGKSSCIDTSQYPNDPNMPELEDITYSDDDDDVGAEADFNNLETSITVSPIPTTRVHKDHLVTQIIGDLSSATQTRSMTREEPKKVHQALKDPSWIEAMQEELLQFKMQKVWVLVDLPHRKRAIVTK
nr:hypothetical protein [Tanacetum cinerariifolium]